MNKCRLLWSRSPPVGSHMSRHVASRVIRIRQLDIRSSRPFSSSYKIATPLRQTRPKSNRQPFSTRYQTRNQSSNHGPNFENSPLSQDSKKNSYLAPTITLTFLTLLSLTYLTTTISTTTSKSTDLFSPPAFTPYTLASKIPLTPTLAILTLTHPNTSPTPLQKDFYLSLFQKPQTWSVEIKQPQLQIARSYTPLPPLPFLTSSSPRYGEFRFLIRKEPGGEMSNYLFGLGVGDQVFLRGPEVETEIGRYVEKVVFLAGGTGIAPALQVCYNLLEGGEGGREKPKIHIFWSCRRREDCVGGGVSSSSSPLSTFWKRKERGVGDGEAGLVVKELKSLQERYPGFLEVDYFVDEEKSFLDQKRIESVVKGKSGVNGKGENLILVSGPEGFVKYFAGAKKWEGEGVKEGQGPVAGMLGRIGLEGWRVWKL